MDRRIFDDWFRTFRASINGYDYYIDFKKVHEKAKKLKVEINILNSLISSKNIEAEFKNIIAEYPKCLKVLPLLLAVRGKEIYCQDVNTACNYRFDEMAQTPEEYAYFMRETGLFNLLQEHIISCLYDYVTGVETGLDSNGRKNRGGHQMENLVAGYLNKSGIEYSREVTMKKLHDDWGININAEITPNKRWDFAVKTEHSLYVIETNFYASGGSKLNETSRSYRKIAEEAKNIDNFVFVWITDGKGWSTARHNLEETFNVLDTLYNISDMENGIFDRIFSRNTDS